MNSLDSIIEKRHQYVANGFASGTSCYIKSAKGALVTDINNNEYIDFAGGIAVMNVGHSHPKVVEAIKDQAEKFIHTCFMVLPYESAVELAQRLCSLVPGDTPKAAMFVNSGAEAVENAVKIARYYTKKQAVIAFESGFHGRTLMGMPLSAVVGKKEIMNSVHPGGIGGTYGANPVACRSALAVLDIVEEENLLQRSNDIGSKLMERLNEFKE
jgi:4-aminobutyrate aminotransferase-like enzyme